MHYKKPPYGGVFGGPPRNAKLTKEWAAEIRSWKDKMTADQASVEIEKKFKVKFGPKAVRQLWNGYTYRN